MSNIRVLFTGPYPFVNQNCSHIPHLRIGKNCPRPGFSVELIVLIANYLNLTIDVIGYHLNDDDDEYFNHLINNNKADLITQLYMKNSTENRQYEATDPFLTVLFFV
jgi:hypothetical protein